MLVARKASCCVANSFSTVLKLIWPRSSLKSTKMSKKHIFCKKFQVGVNGLKLVLINIPNHDLWICTYQPSTKKDSKHKVLIQAEFLWSESTKIKIKGKDHHPKAADYILWMMCMKASTVYGGVSINILDWPSLNTPSTLDKHLDQHVIDTY